MEADPTVAVTVDLIDRQVRTAGLVADFEIDDYTRWRLLEGLDDIGLALRHTADIDAFEARRPTYTPRVVA